jgi:xylulose-5-phosphate/fructose-6-phosphate phosphoketolase
MFVNGYREEGTTTTPLDMLLRNRVSRYDVAMRALQAGAKREDAISRNLGRCIEELEGQMKGVREYIQQNGKGESIGGDGWS